MSEEIKNENLENVEEVVVENTEEVVNNSEIDYKAEFEKLQSQNSKLQKDFEDLTNTVKSYVPQEKLLEMEAANTEKLNQIKIENDLNLELYGNENLELIKSQINYNNLSVSENGTLGVKEELDRIKSKFPVLFQKAQSTKPSNTPSISTQTTSQNSLSASEQKKRDIQNGNPFFSEAALLLGK